MAEIELIKISGLPATSTIGDADELAVVQGGATKKVPYSVLKAGAEVTPDTTLSEAGVPADAAAVGAALAQKANQAAVTQALAAKADKSEVTDISGDIAELASVVETKADQTALNQKADKTTTDALRQDLTTLNGIVNQKADKTELNTQIGNVTAELATKANANDVTEALALKADTATVNASLATKANTSTVNAALALKADKTELTAGLATKQDVLTFDSTPTEGSTNPVTSGGVWEAANVKVDKDGVGQVTPQNIEGVTVTGGNIIDDAERIYCTQLGAETTDGYVVIANGAAIIQTSSPFCSFLVPIKPNTHYTANYPIRFAVLLNNLATDGTTPVRYSTVIGSALANILAFDSGEADHIIVSWNYNTYPIDSFVISEGDTPTADKTITLPDWWTGGSTPTVVEKPKFATVTGDMVSGGNLQLPSARSNLRKGERIVFEGNITNFSTLTIGLTRFTYDLGNNANSENIFVIDGTNITYKAYPTATAVTVPHGLTISENIQIIWEMTATASCKITLISDGVLFSHEFTNFVRQVIGNPFVYSADSELTGCKLTWTCTDINKSIWMFGDSYFGYAESRWTYYLHQYGYDNNCLLDGFPGEGGVNGRVAFNNLLQFGTPKFAVWCLGMNDTADSESAPATAWVANMEYFLEYCTQNNIIPIFGTIPTVPSINHEQKNAWIRSSGYRYIDFAKAVGASASGVWFSGMLSSDNVHPTPQGARALFARVLLDLPEIMLDGTN